MTELGSVGILTQAKIGHECATVGCVCGESQGGNKFPLKRRGEIAEIAFLLKAISLGFGVAKPWGDSDRFDFILTCRHLLWRVQVKSAWCGPPYRIKGSGVSNIPYTVNEIDFVAGYIIP
jgi:hypothetical protein